MGRKSRSESAKKANSSLQSVVPGRNSSAKQPGGLCSVEPAIADQIQVARHRSPSYNPSVPEGCVRADDTISATDSADKSSKGKTNYASSSSVNKDFEFQETPQQLSILLDGDWQPAIWHHDLVAQLDKDVFGVHLYDTTPPRRSENQPPEDITAFLPQQKDWGFCSRKQHPEIIFHLYPPAEYFADISNKPPWLRAETQGTSLVVVDIISRRPLRNFGNIPLQLATNVEGGRLEAMTREDSRIICEDFLQRMIPVLDETGKPQISSNGRTFSERPLKKSLANARIQFRNQYRCISWTSKKHDSEFDVRLMSDLTETDKDTNMTKNLPELSNAEITLIRSAAKGRKVRPLEAGGEEAAEAVTLHESNIMTTEDAAKIHTASSAAADDKTNKEAATESDIQRFPKDSQAAVSGKPTKTGRITKNRRRAPVKPSNKAGKNQNVATTEILKGQLPHDSPLSDPRTSARAVEVPRAISQETSTSVQPNRVSLDLNTAPSIPQERVGQRPEAADATPCAARDLPHQEPETADRGHDDFVVCKSEASLLVPTNKEQTALPPRYPERVVNSSSIGQPRNEPPAFEVVRQDGGSHRHPAQSQSLFSESQNTSIRSGSHEAAPDAAPAVGPRTFLVPPANCPMPYQPEARRIAEEEQARFTFVTRQITQLSMLKDKLIHDWWAKQSAGPLYGRVLTIPLGHLGSRSSYRTDKQMRTFMAAYGIPSSFSAASVDLRYFSSLNLAVHNAICEAEAWNRNNYRVDYPNFLELRTDGGFFLALSQPSSIGHNDSRFSFFPTSASLNACMHTALWRYRQLTGRDFAPEGYQTFHSESRSTYQESWCSIRRQLFLPYFLRFTDHVEAVAWMPDLGKLDLWTGGPDNWRASVSHIHDEFGCRDDAEMKGALDPRRFRHPWGWRQEKKGVLPLICVDLEGGRGLG